MALGHVSRRNLLDRLSRIATAALGSAKEVSHIDVRAAPQGIAHTGFSIAKVDSRDEPHRGGRGSLLLKRHSVTLRYAHRVKPNDKGTSRRDAMDRIDALERALRNSASPDVGAMEIDGFSVAEQQTSSREWLVYDCAVDVHCAFQLQAPEDAETAA